MGRLRFCEADYSLAEEEKHATLLKVGAWFGLTRTKISDAVSLYSGE